jgi:uncharacterized protein
MNQNTTFAVIAIVAALALVGVAVLTVAAISTQAFAQTFTCTNPAGNAPPGQQPVCKSNGHGLTQEII